jgi:hypothetical protein
MRSRNQHADKAVRLQVGLAMARSGDGRAYHTGGCISGVRIRSSWTLNLRDRVLFADNNPGPLGAKANGFDPKSLMRGLQ